jgi:predicted dienelactone hydrolase
MEIMGPALAKKLNLPTYFLEHIKYSQSHAVINAPISNSKSKYPLLLFSHGWGGFKSQNTFQMEQLASYGYIVIAPDHTYGAIATVLPDGSVALNNPDALPLGSNLSDDKYLAAVQQLGDQWSGDLSFVLDYLVQPEVDGFIGKLVDRLDFSRIGVLGHSTGGGAAIQFCANDTRCQLALGMDPYMDPVSFQIQEQGLSKPYLAMFSESWAIESGRNNSIFNSFFEKSIGDRYRYILENTAHYDFTDLPAFSPLAPYLGLKGTLDGKQVSKIINAYSLAFFGRYLMGESGTLLDKPTAEYPEIKILH